MMILVRIAAVAVAHAAQAARLLLPICYTVTLAQFQDIQLRQNLTIDGVAR